MNSSVVISAKPSPPGSCTATVMTPPWSVFPQLPARGIIKSHAVIPRRSCSSPGFILHGLPCAAVAFRMTPSPPGEIGWRWQRLMWPAGRHPAFGFASAPREVNRSIALAGPPMGRPEFAPGRQDSPCGRPGKRGGLDELPLSMLHWQDPGDGNNLRGLRARGSEWESC